MVFSDVSCSIVPMLHYLCITILRSSRVGSILLPAENSVLLMPSTIGLANKFVGFFCKIRHIFFFISTNNFIDLDSLSMSASSCMVYNVDCCQCLSLIAINFSWSTGPGSIIQREISSIKLHKSLLICLTIHCTNLFCVFHLHFYLF